MSKENGKGRRGGHWGTAGRANTDLLMHIASLGLGTILEYQRCYRSHGITTAVKSWQGRDLPESERQCRKVTYS